MRFEKTITLSTGRVAVVRELRLKDVRRLMKELQAFATLDIGVLFGEKFDELLGVAGELVTMPDGETAEDLSLSELETVLDALKEVNAGFLEKLGMSVALVTPADQTRIEPSAASTEPAVA